MIRRISTVSSSYRQSILAIALFTVLAIAMTWPLATQIDKAVIGWVGDNFYFVWLIAWCQKSLYVLHQSPLLVPFLNYPEGWNLAYNEITPAMVLVALPVSSAGGPTLAYNFSILLSFILSGFGVYLWVRRLSNNSAAGVVAGTVFAFTPYRMSHVLGHFNLMGTQWIPLYFLSLSEMVEARHWSPKSMALSAVFLGLISLTSQYYLYMTLIISVVFLVGYWLVFDRKLFLQIKSWKRLGLFGAISLPILAIGVMPYLQLGVQNNLATHTLEDVRVWSASPTDFILPSPEHFIWGAWIAQNFDRKLWIESSLYLGAVALVLAGLALVQYRQARLGDSIVPIFVFTAFIAFLLALGTDFHWLGQPVVFDVPQLIQHWYPHPRALLPLPDYFLFKFLPFYANMRVWMRYGLFVNMFVSVLAGIGAGWLLGRFKRRAATVVSASILILVLIDFYPGMQSLSEVRGRSVDDWLASQVGDGAVVQMPFGQVTLPEQTYYTMIYNKPFVGGFFAAFSSPQFEHIQPILSAFPDSRSVQLLRELGVRWIIVDSTPYDDFEHLKVAIESFDLHPSGVFGNQYVYELR